VVIYHGCENTAILSEDGCALFQFKKPFLPQVFFEDCSMKIIYLMGLMFLTACTQDQQNQLSRKVVELMDGDYLVTYANGTTTKTWTIKNGKVTSSDKGYYYFWDSKKHYVQVPIVNTFIEEVDP
jgi:hypothetical protein